MTFAPFSEVVLVVVAVFAPPSFLHTYVHTHAHGWMEQRAYAANAITSSRGGGGQRKDLLGSLFFSRAWNPHTTPKPSPTMRKRWTNQRRFFLHFPLFSPSFTNAAVYIYVRQSTRCLSDPSIHPTVQPSVRPHGLLSLGGLGLVSGLPPSLLRKKLLLSYKPVYRGVRRRRRYAAVMRTAKCRSGRRKRK